MKEKLKIGLMLGDNMVQAWEYKIIEEIYNSDFAKIAVVINNNSNDICAKRTRNNSRQLINKLLEKTDRFIFKTELDYKQKKDSSVFLKDIHEFISLPVKDVCTEIFSEEEINEIKKYNLDLIIKFGFRNLKGSILKIPKYGIWSYSIVDPLLINGVETCSQQMGKKLPVTSSVLNILREDPVNNTAIFISSELTCHYSTYITYNTLFWRASLFIPRILNVLYENGDNYLNYLMNRFKTDSRNIKSDLSNYSLEKQAPRTFYKFFFVIGRQIIKKLIYSDDFRWKLLFKIDDGKDFSTSFDSFNELPINKDRFWADPFVIYNNSKYYIFAEEFLYKKHKGHISVIELDEKGNLLSSTKIIEKPYHMSYPFIFEIDNTFYMIPETCENKTIDLYKCISFPNRWEFVKSIMKNLSAVDTTLFYYADKWWLFTSIDGTNGISGGSTELFLFFNDNIFSDNWVSHPNNPIVSDVRTARPAGKVFIHESKIYRPSQDCSERYGNGLNLNQITTLTDTEYHEVLYSKVEPVWDSTLKGTHTFNFDRKFTVIDVYSYRKRI